MWPPQRPEPQLPVCQELQLRWQEYRELVLLLLQWVRHHTAAFEERKFPSSFEEIEVGPPPPRPTSPALPLGRLPTAPAPLGPHRSCGANS